MSRTKAESYCKERKRWKTNREKLYHDNNK